MWFLHGLPVVVLIFTFQCHLCRVSGSIPSTQMLEESIKLKLRTSATIRDNLGKILSQLPLTDYEFLNSVELVRGFLKRGGSVIESLDVLPQLGYVTMNKQINGILAAMEDHSPRFLLPAIGVIRSGIRKYLNLEEIFRPYDGPPTADLFEGILAQDLPKIAFPTPFPDTLEQNVVRGPWPYFISEIMSLIITGTVKPSKALIGLILVNLNIFTDNPEVKESARYLADLLIKDQDQLSGSEPVQEYNPYKLVRNTIMRIAEDDLMKEAVDTLLPYLRTPVEENTNNPELGRFYLGRSLNYTLVILNDKRLITSKPGAMILSAIQRGEINLNQALDGLLLHEYKTPRDFLIAIVSKLRRYQAHQGVISDVVESLYGELTQKYNHGDWKNLIRSAGSMRAMLYGMRTEASSVRIRRLANDISAGLEENIVPEFWPMAVNHAPDGECHGPSCLVQRTLEGLQEVGAIRDPALNASVVELLNIFKQNDMSVSVICPKLVKDDSYRESVPTEKAVDIADLLQALPNLNVHTEEYNALKKLLSGDNLEKELGEVIDIEEHPTRGRLLAWLLRKVEKLNGVDQKIREVARNWTDTVSYYGYGAARVVLCSA